jgi:transposase
MQKRAARAVSGFPLEKKRADCLKYNQNLEPELCLRRLDLTPAVGKKISVEYNRRRGKQGTKRRVYTQEFKTESVALVANHEQPVSQIAADLGINQHMLRRWVQSRTGSAAGTCLRPFPGHGRPRDKKLTHLRKEVKALRNAHEILKKAAVIFAQGELQ